MKKIIFLFLSALVVSCASSNKVATDKNDIPPPPPPVPATATLEAQTSQKLMMADNAKLKDGHLYGKQVKSAFSNDPFAQWFKPRYEAYNLDDAMVTSLKNNLEGTTIKAFMGSWCGDSKRETPKFYKLLEQTQYNMNNLELVAVDRSKKEPVDLVAGNDIIRVPTFIFYKDGKEVGRFVERPRESLEADVLKIVSGQDYKHAYEK